MSVRVIIALVCVAAPAWAGDRVDFQRDVRPILSQCIACHGPDEAARKGKLRLDTREGALKDGAVQPGKPDDSSMIERITSTDADTRMPPAKSGKMLTPAEIDTLKRWIAEGAEYRPHWSYQPPVRPVPPAGSGKNEIDRFIVDAQRRRKLTSSPEADRYDLVRRVALDVTGLPPTMAEADEFVYSTSPDAYEKWVDRLLTRPSYGEHMARLWLDLARYADSAGYADDPPREIWAYRDYVIRSFNANKPFDQFTIEQLAGDLLPNATEEQLIATAFHRNTMTNSEGGTNDEEFRNVAVVDRVNTTMLVWMGTSMACCQCHTHKYDPITQKEYFQFFAFFNNTADADRNDEAPRHMIMTPTQKKDREDWQRELAKLDQLLAVQGAVMCMGQDDWEEQVLPESLPANVAKALVSKARTPQQLESLAQHYWRNVSPERDGERQRHAQLSALLKKQKLVTVPIMQELTGKARRTTRVQLRGNFLDLGDTVTEGTPAAFPPLPKDAPRNRLTLARWLVDPGNPLTARVIANRTWEQLFGQGLVRTSEEFGSQGELPSHPELLDWLATELIRLKWDMKAFIRLIVTSQTYRQSSRVTREQLEADHDNRWLTRGPRQRLTAEMLRDQTLFAAGLLSGKMYGPSVRPPQPALGVNAAFGGAIDWQTSEGEDRYRRGLYTMWRRSNLYPSMSTFDAPNRDICSVRRFNSNTPLQALVTLNDAVCIEAAQALARLVLQQEHDDATRATLAFRRCATRPPNDAEVARLVKLLRDTRATFEKDPAKAEAMAGTKVNSVELASWTVVANVLLNLDEVLMKR